MFKSLKIIFASLFLMAFTINAQAVVVEYNFGGADNIDTEDEIFIIENIGDSGTILDVNVFLHVDGNEHAIYADNLFIWLKHDGEKVMLISATDDSEGAYIFAWLDDEATDSLPYGGAIDGDFNPVEALSAFDGMDIFGNWTLSFRDDIVPFDGTDLIEWSLQFTVGDDFDSVPEPTPLALLGFGLLGLALARKRRR